MKVLLSTGIGRLHFTEAALYIARVVDVLEVVGDSGIARFVSRVSTLADRICNCGYGMRAFAWMLSGWASIGHMGGKDVFHVRSGAGRGGAIRAAKRLGMKVLVDHSALHPAESNLNLEEDCSRWGVPAPVNPNVGIWENVMKDCVDADMVMVNANHIRNSFVMHGFDPTRIRVAYLGVRNDFRGVAFQRMESVKVNDVPRVLYTGNFSILKGAEYILDSLRILNRRGVKVQYDIVGAVSVPKAMMANIRELPIAFHGPVLQDNLKQFLAESDIYLFPSLADGCAQSGMEALTAGLPVVATYQSGLPIKDGETGCIVPMKNAQAIADKIEWLIANPKERDRIGRNAAEMMRETYTWEKYAENVKTIYEELMR